MNSWIQSLVSPKIAGSIAWAGGFEFAAATQDDRTGRTVRFRLVREPQAMLEAHPFSKYTRRRRGHAGTRFEAVFTEVGTEKPVSLQVMLLGWNDGPQGATVTFLLDNEAEKHPFMWCHRKSKDAAGTRFEAVFLELDDDEEIVNQAKRDRVESGGRKQHLSNVARLLTKNERFHEWLGETADLPLGAEAWSTEVADAWLKDLLGITTKAALDDPRNMRIIANFQRVAAAFLEWQHDQGYNVTERD